MLKFYCKSPTEKIFYREHCKGAYLSPAPQAEPQAVGVSSVLSPAPQAEPQAAGVSLVSSEAPQAEPQEEDTPPLSHANKLDNAIIDYLLCFSENLFSL